MVARNASHDEITTLLEIAEKLLSLAEIQAETNLADTRSRHRFRREIAEQLSSIETALARVRTARDRDLEDDPPLLKRSELGPLLRSAWPYFVAALSAVSGWAWHLFHHS